MMDPLKSTEEILQEATGRYNPYAIVMMLSGGNDSMSALHACLKLGTRIDYVLHVNTKTGIRETTEFVRAEVERLGIAYLEADAGTRYRDRVLSKGFLGVGTGKQSAHTFAFHLLKEQVYRAAIAQLRQRKRNRPILLLNGARARESENRWINLGSNPIRQDSNTASNVWVNVIHNWSKEDCRSFLREQKCPTNRVSEVLCRSGECMCGTVQGQQARQEAAYWFPEWGKWLDRLEAEVKQRFPWGWGEPIPQQWAAEKKGQLRLFDDEFQPMCSDCVRRAG